LKSRRRKRTRGFFIIGHCFSTSADLVILVYNVISLFKFSEFVLVWVVYEIMRASI
jgi:hypothetical protein